MKFCKFCGSPLDENAVCNCPAAVAERQGQAAPQYVAPRYAAQPAAPKAQKNVMGDLLKTATGYFKNAKKTVEERKQAKDFITPAIICGVLFLVLIAVNSCIFGKTSAMMLLPATMGWTITDDFGFNFGFVVLAALIETLVIPALYVCVKFVASLIFVRPVKLQKFFFDSFISFGVHSVVPIAAILVGGLLYLATSFLAQIFFVFAMFWYALALLNELNEEIPADKRNLLTTVIVVALLVVAATAYVLMYRLMFLMNMGHSIAEVKTEINLVSQAISEAQRYVL